MNYILLFLCHPIIIKHKFEVTNHEAISFNKESSPSSLIYFAYK